MAYEEARKKARAFVVERFGEDALKDFEVLKRIYENGDHSYLNLDFMGCIIELMGETGDLKSIPYLISLLQNYPSSKCLHASIAFGLLPEECKEAALAPLVHQWQHKYNATSDYTLNALIALGDIAVKSLSDALMDPNVGLRSSRIVHALYEIATVSARHMLIRGLMHENLRVSEGVAYGLFMYSDTDKPGFTWYEEARLAIQKLPPYTEDEIKELRSQRNRFRRGGSDYKIHLRHLNRVVKHASV